MTKSQAIRKLWKLGMLSWKLRPEQKRLRDLLEAAPTDMCVFNISRRFGKSTTCCLFAVEQALRKKQKVLYSTAYLSDLETFITPIFEWVLSDCPEDLRPVWKASKKEFHFRNGSLIKLIGLDRNANSLRGNNIDVIIVDEAAFVTKLEYLYKSVIVPATMKRKFKLIFPSTPPESPEHFWSKELIPKSRLKDAYAEMTIDEISDLSEEEKQRLLDEVGGKDSPTAQREFYCKIIVDVTRAIAPSFKEEIHVGEFEIDNIKWDLFGDSGGIKDKTVFHEVGYSHETGLIYFRSELYFDNQTPSSTIISSVKETWENRTITLDAAGQLLIDYSSLGLSCGLPQKDDFGAGLLLINNHFHLNRVLIHPRCKLLVQTLKGGLLNKHRTDYERSETLGHCDAVASAIYAIRGVDKITDLRPKPKASEVFTIKKPTPLERSIKGLSAR